MSEAIHPEIGSLIRKRDDAYQAIFVNSEYELGLSILEAILREIDRTDKNLLSEIIDEEKALFFLNVGKKKDRIKEFYWSYREWYDKVNDLLWLHYLRDSFQMYYPAQDLTK